MRIQAAVETHQFAVRYLQANVAAGTTVLDVAAGEGALSKQLQDVGLKTACTSWNDKCKVEAPQYRVDLDHPFSTADVGTRDYAAICAIEIVEHVENPSAFLRSCAAVLKPGGTLIISTPNVESIAARMQWFMRGCPRIFSDHEVRQNRHISMLWSQGFEVLIEHAGLRVVDRQLLGRFRMSRSLLTPIKRLGYRLLGRLLSGDTEGTTRLYVLTHSADGVRTDHSERVY
jgi:cyclopropane fatty-acyl-phospholipid synthase-like methyltransferase